MRPVLLVLLAAAFVLVVSARGAIAQTFHNFESPQTRPIAVSADGTRLFAVNTPDNRLAVYSLRDPAAPVLLREIPVGLEPVSVVPRTPDEVWVVNHLSDSISVVSLSLGAVVDTIQVKDEPKDVAFAGGRAFVSVATDREVRVFDTTSRRAVGTVAVFGDSPRALLAAEDGRTVWVAVHRSGNGTTVVPADIAPRPPAPTNPNLPAAPDQGIIVRADDPNWRNQLNVTLPDYDVVEIDVASLAVRTNYTGVGTVLFNLVQRPGTDDVWVANTEALNQTRFVTALRGHPIDNRVTRITTGQNATVTTIDLNPGVNYAVLPNNAALANALAQPTDLVFSPDGATLFVAAFGTDRIGVLSPTGAVVSRIDVGTTPGSATDPRTKRGPRGLAHHPTAARLYVFNRLANSITVVDTANERVLAEIPMIHDPTPAQVREARGFLYDAKLSGNGTVSCASCHIDSEFDGIGWDLGDPGGTLATVNSGGRSFTFHPMKGPMTTQTLRGLAGHEPFHWRGDRPDFQAFNKTFDELLGGSALAPGDRDDFAAFARTIAFPPNPHMNLDRTYATSPAGTSASEGLTYFSTVKFDRRVRCIDCHALPTGTVNLIVPRTFLRAPQDMKVPQLRNVYKRTPAVSGTARTSGFALTHDGAIASTFELLGKSPFGQLTRQTNNKTMLQNLVQSFDSGTAPTVGYSRTINAANVDDSGTVADVQLLAAEAVKRNCDVVAKAMLDGEAAGFAYDTAQGVFLPDRAGAPSMTSTQLRAAVRAGRGVVTIMGVPPGAGQRIGRDRDDDSILDGDEGLMHYGAASPSCSSLTIAANAPPTVGNDQFALVTRGNDAGSFGFVLFGFADTIAPVGDLVLLVANPLLLPYVSDGTGVGVVPFGIPDVPALRGQTAYFQAASVSRCSTSGYQATGGLRVTVGS